MKVNCYLQLASYLLLVFLMSVFNSKDHLKVPSEDCFFSDLWLLHRSVHACSRTRQNVPMRARAHTHHIGFLAFLAMFFLFDDWFGPYFHVFFIYL